MRILTPITNASTNKHNKFRNIAEVEALLRPTYTRKRDTAGRLQALYADSLTINMILSVFEHQFKTHKRYLDVKDKAMSLKTEMLHQRDDLLKKCRPTPSKDAIVKNFNLLTQGANKAQISFKGITYYYAGFSSIHDDSGYCHQDYWFCLTKDQKRNFCLSCLPRFLPPEAFQLGIPVLDIEDILIVLADEGFQWLGDKYDDESMLTPDTMYTAR